MERTELTKANKDKTLSAEKGVLKKLSDISYKPYSNNKTKNPEQRYKT